MSSRLVKLSDKIEDCSKVGGKGLNLMKLTSAGFNVPGGFILPCDVLEGFFQSNEIYSEIVEVLEGLKQDSGKFSTDLKLVEDTSTRITEIIKKGTISENTIKSVEREMANLGGEIVPVSVRSSGVNEDLEEFSFAGQYETFLNVLSLEDVLEKIKMCWASLFSVRCLVYQIQNGFLKDSTKFALMAVVVQRMVPADVSGVLFTCDINTGHRGRVLISAGLGVGEGVVSGMVEVDEFLVQKPIFGASLSILKRHVAVKSKRVEVDNEKGSVKVVEIIDDDLDEESASVAKSACLTDKQVLELAEMGHQIEVDIYERVPQDIEFAIHEELIYVLQSRAVTAGVFQPVHLIGGGFAAGSPLRLPKGVDHFDGKAHEKWQREFMMGDQGLNQTGLKILMNFGPPQAYPGPFSEMGASMFETISRVTLGALHTKAEPERLYMCGNRLFFSLGDMFSKMSPKSSLTKSNSTSKVSEKVMKALLHVVIKPKLYKSKFIPSAKIVRVVPTIAKVVGELVKGVFTARKNTPEKYETKMEGMFGGVIEKMKNEAGGEISSQKKEAKESRFKQAVQKLNAVVKLLEVHLLDSIYRSIGGLMTGLWGQLITGKLSNEDDNSVALKIFGGLEGDITLLMVEMLSTMSFLGRNNNSVIAFLNEIKGKEMSYKAATEILTGKFEKRIMGEEKENGEEFIRLFHEFFEKFWFRAPGEIEISNIRYHENIDFIVDSIICGMVHEHDEMKKRKESAKARSEEEIEKMVEKVKRKSKREALNYLTLGIHSKLKTKITKDMIYIARKNICFREHPKYYWMRAYGEVREQLLEIGTFLAEEGFFETKRRVFHVTIPELCEILEDYAQPKNSEIPKITRQFVRELTNYRHARMEKFRKIRNPPEVMTSLGEDIVKTYEREYEPHLDLEKKQEEENDPTLLRGQGVSTGIVEGTVRIIETASECSRLQSGDILVTNHTDPGFTPAFLKATGLVLEVGGMVTHGALVAREMGLPCVSGVALAMEKLSDGDKVLVNGTTGIVKILEKKKQLNEDVDIEVIEGGSGESEDSDDGEVYEIHV